MKIHKFSSTGEAYDACQCDDEISNGDLLVIESEQVVGIADTWPFAITKKSGELHGINGDLGLAFVKATFPAYAAAVELAAALGYPV